MMIVIADTNKLPKFPENLSRECRDFIEKCLTREYESRPSAE